MATDQNTLPYHQSGLDRVKESYHTFSNVRINKSWLKSSKLHIQGFLLATWPDWLAVAIVGAIAAGVWSSPQSFARYIPIAHPGGQLYWPELAYPFEEPLFSSTLAGVLSASIPISVFALAQLWMQSFADFASAGLGLAYSMVTGTCFQVILKKTIGGLRPHFLTVCQPQLPPADGSIGVGYRNTMYTVDQICTGDPRTIKNALESFPSGHAEVAFAGLGYLAIYLFAHLRITSRDRKTGSLCKMLCVVAPLLLATYIASTLVLTYHHHGYDVVFGALVGWCMAMFGYRMVFMSLTNSGWNTVPCLLREADDPTTSPLP